MATESINEKHTRMNEIFFDKIVPRAEMKDWKGRVEVECEFDELVDFASAIEYITATKADILGLGNRKYRLTAKGYRMGPAGDH